MKTFFSENKYMPTVFQFSFLIPFVSVCQLCFYNSNLLARHLTSVHNIRDASLLKIYSCIYCPLTDSDINHLRLHVATKHPGEIPQLYDRNGQVHKTEVLF